MRILCIGDSNTWGYNPEDSFRHKNRWTRVLAEIMPEQEIIEEGMNGRTLLSVDPYMPERCGIKGLKMMLMSHKPVDLVILMLGTNELKVFFPGTAEYIASGVEEFIKIIKDADMWARFNVPKLLVVSPVHIRDELITNGDAFGGEFNDESVKQSKLMANCISKVCHKYGVEFMDAAEYAEASIIDNIHLDETNHKKLAEAIASRI